jgi:hypothetical protein
VLVIFNFVNSHALWAEISLYGTELLHCVGPGTNSTLSSYMSRSGGESVQLLLEKRRNKNRCAGKYMTRLRLSALSSQQHTHCAVMCTKRSLFTNQSNRAHATCVKLLTVLNTHTRE